jgi:hypothetical protein
MRGGAVIGVMVTSKLRFCRINRSAMRDPRSAGARRRTSAPRFFSSPPAPPTPHLLPHSSRPSVSGCRATFGTSVRRGAHVISALWAQPALEPAVSASKLRRSLRQQDPSRVHQRWEQQGSMADPELPRALLKGPPPHTQFLRSPSVETRRRLPRHVKDDPAVG